MGHEISQFDIPDRQLLATNAQPRVSMPADIGEAKIIHTIFGRARVRITRERDKKRRAWLLAALAVTAITAAAWQGWIVLQQNGPLAAPPPLSARIRVSAPTIQPENIPPTPTPPSVRSKPVTPLQTEINKLATSQMSAPQPPPGLKAAGPMAAKPVTAQPLIANKPQTASLAANNNPSKDQTDKPLPPGLSAPVQPAAPAVATPRATLPVAQAAASSPAAVAPLAAPLAKENTPTLSPAGDNQPSDPVNAQP